ncbi:hypothetical protein Dimus_015218 [Dionaea muscipula]
MAAVVVVVVAAATAPPLPASSFATVVCCDVPYLLRPIVVQHKRYEIKVFNYNSRLAKDLNYVVKFTR